MFCLFFPIIIGKNSEKLPITSNSRLEMIFDVEDPSLSESEIEYTHFKNKTKKTHYCKTNTYFALLRI